MREQGLMSPYVIDESSEPIEVWTTLDPTMQSAAERAIVGHPVLIGRKFADVVNIYLDNPGKPRAANYSKIKDLSKKLRENCQNVYLHFGF